MMDPIHHPGEPFVKPRRPKPIAVAIFLLLAIIGILVAGLVVVLIWNALTGVEGGGYTNVDAAKMGVRHLEAAALGFYTRHNRYPITLEELTRPQGEGDKTVDPRDLIDPWGNPYTYEPETLHPHTEIPLIYSNGPPGANKPIRNWN
jgi:hypothetical protein